MALINCPECQRQVSDQAPSCPQCGYPLASRGVSTNTSIPAPTVTRIQHEEVNRGFSKGMDKGMEQIGTGCFKFIIAGIVCAVILVAFFIRSQLICKTCNGSGTSLVFMKCDACAGTGWKK